MNLTHISLTNYRNLQAEELKFGDHINVIVGDNGQGKTNILEAVYLCCTGRSHRVSQSSDLIRWGQASANISLTCLHQDSGLHYINILLKDQGGKIIQVNGSNITKLGDLMGHLRAVIFSPEDLNLVKNGPSFRRRFMDMALSQIYTDYFVCLQTYQKILMQRNILLKNPAKALDTLPIWNVQLSEVGNRIISYRRQFCYQLSCLIPDIYSDISAEETRLSAQYQCCIGEKQGNTALLELFEKSQGNDLKYRTTTCGIHREDILLQLDNRDLRHIGSQGQQRTAVLSFKLAEAAIMRERTGEHPILLLDDVFSELDESRRCRLLIRLAGLQAIITNTEFDRKDYADAFVSAVFDVHQGKVSEQLREPAPLNE